MMKKSAEELSDKLSGDLTEDEIKNIIAAHNKKLGELGDQFDAQKNRQQAELMEKLAQRRMRREQALREQHAQIVSFRKIRSIYELAKIKVKSDSFLQLPILLVSSLL